MSDKIKAVYAYTPRVKLEPVVELHTLSSFIEGRTSFNRGAVVNMLTEISEAIVFFCMSGQPVRLPGVGILAPKVTKDGVYGLNFKMDAWLKSEMNVKGKFKGRVVNRDMIGKSVDEMVDRWNEEHPDDKIKPDKEK